MLQHYFVGVAISNCFMIQLTRDEQDHIHSNQGIEDIEVQNYTVIKCDAICKNLPYGGTNIEGPEQMPRMMRGV